LSPANRRRRLQARQLRLPSRPTNRRQLQAERAGPDNKLINRRRPRRDSRLTYIEGWYKPRWRLEPASEVGDDGWRATFAAIVDPLPRLARALLPAMIARRSGKFLVMSSATALRGQSLTSTYCSARGAQLAWAQSAGVELAQHNVQVNAIAFNFLDNPTYFPAEKQADPRFQERLKREVPLGRMVSAGEGAEFTAYLCSATADCFVGQVFPVCGGWLQR
jgi:2-keto-3-deoxy-L-fuconate dehydrogenase